MKQKKISNNFTAYELIFAGETVNKLELDNIPKNEQTWNGLAQLSQNLLEPLTLKFGKPLITYCFASHALTRNIKKNICPALDQHAGSELQKNNKFICSRLGQAVDLYYPDIDSRELSAWIVENINFDRMYYYGPDRPIHVSVGPQNSKSLIFMQPQPTGRRIPRKISMDWLKKINSTNSN